ncbi:MAG TPA: site-2 protease family protein [Tepidisphaeraceae bacterium]
MTLLSIFNLFLVAIAFGFVIFWHELGHFLAARWAGVRVEQFAVGMGQALVSYRKGIGLRFAGFGKGGWHWGSTQDDFDKRVSAEFARREDERRQTDLQFQESNHTPTLREQYDIAKDLGIGETEYRLSWIPLGGYVKPTGQDDLRPAAQVASDDPHAFGAKPVGKRMVIISAGVVMNVILAFFLYIALFMHGFNAPPAVVGMVMPNSPAQAGGLQVGDRIRTINGHVQNDYTKITMNVALLPAGEPAEVVVERPDESQEKKLQITPVKSAGNHNMPAIGVLPSPTLQTDGSSPEERLYYSAGSEAMPAGSQIIKVQGQTVGPNDYYILDRAIQASGGKPVDVTIRRADGSEHPFAVQPTIELSNFAATAERAAISLLGIQPRVSITAVKRGGPADVAGVRPGDVILQIFNVSLGEALQPPSYEQFLERVNAAGQNAHKIRFQMLRNDQTVDSQELVPTDIVNKKRRGISVLPGFDLGHVIVGAVAADSAAAKAGLAKGDRITAVNDAPVGTWFDLMNQVGEKAGTMKLSIERDGKPQALELAVSDADAAHLGNMQLTHTLPLTPLIEPRITTNPLTAAAWGYEETKFAIFHVYRTLRSLFQGDVPLSNLSGPLGIFSAGSAAADRGPDWLIWFTALISANLAVVNFLPIPIVDGGLFLFLLAEKFTGRPPSPRLQAAAQVIGLVLLGSLFLFVTYHDILRQWG